jgi:hypothetical protein
LRGIRIAANSLEQTGTEEVFGAKSSFMARVLAENLLRPLGTP